MTALTPVVIVTAAAVAAAQAVPGQLIGGINVDPAEVSAGMFYTGATVHVSAVVPLGAEVAMVCLDEGHPVKLKKKGKALGVIWMNVADVSFGEVPDLYLLRTSNRLDRLAGPAALADLALGYAALQARADPGPGAEALFGELTRLKQRDRLWHVSEGSVHLQPAGSGMALATADFALPAKAPPGAYQVLVYAFRDGTGELAAEGSLRIRQVGVAAFISTLATGQGFLYGGLAALIAVIVGLATGVVFGLGSKGGH
ncbi:MAG: TIGR02186 family protein [Gemmatimonadota bacterium]|jgi:uncharacterized protein (TIGR02186 family)